MEKKAPKETKIRPVKESDTPGQNQAPDDDKSDGDSAPAGNPCPATTSTTKKDAVTSSTPATSVVVASSPRLYVGNLHPRVTQVHLESLLNARSLAVQRIQFISNANHQGSHAFCFVTLPSIADATRAIQLLHGRKLMGRSLVVQPAHEQQQHQSAGERGSRISSSSSLLPGGGRKERRQLDDQIAAIRQKLQEKDG